MTPAALRAAFLPIVLAAVARASPAADLHHVDRLISVKLASGYEQTGVLTTVTGDEPATLVLLFPGTPAVLKAEVVDSVLVKSRVLGNPLVRARKLLVTPGIAALIIDCRSDQTEECGERYVMSGERFEDVLALVNAVRRELKELKAIWIVGHSLGSLSSASLARRGEGVFDGAIHVSTILSVKGHYRSLVGFDFSAARIPQLFIHHRDDPCVATPFYEAKSVAKRYGIPIIEISQAAGVKGDPCGAFSEHGFAGAEEVLMRTISEAVEHGIGRPPS